MRESFSFSPKFVSDGRRSAAIIELGFSGVQALSTDFTELP